MILAGLRRRWGRAAALLLGVLMATTGFTVLTGSTATSRLVVEGTVDEHARGAYDILVRPADARTNLEAGRGLVKANFLAGLYGGITAEQWHRIEAIDGVDVAAPIAMLGYVTAFVGAVTVDVTELVDPSLETQLIRVNFTWSGDRGLTNAAEPAPAIIYVTKRPLVRLKELPAAGEPVLYDDGVYRPQDECGPDSFAAIYEVQPDGRTLPLCLGRYPGDQRGRVGGAEAQLTPRGTFIFHGAETPRLLAEIIAPMPMLAAAIDPTTEARLVGLDRAVVKGRYLTGSEAATADGIGAPVLLAADPYLDERADAVAERIANPDLAGLDNPGVSRLVAAATPQAAAPAEGQAVQDLYRKSTVAASLDQADGASVVFVQLLRAEAADYDVEPDGALRPRTAPDTAAAALTSAANSGFTAMPWLATDSAHRATSPASDTTMGLLHFGQPVGVFDRARLAVGDGLGAPLETYTQSSATGADERSRDLLGGQPLLPTSNMGGYLSTSPSVLMALDTLWQPGGAADAISAVRVRVAGVTGFDDLSRERVRLVAEDIAAATGLDVEVMLGASGSPQTIELPAGRYGRPELRLHELWSKKGVAAAIVQAIDRKSAILFGLILVVCVLFVANAAAAAVRDRRRELAVLACLGWPRHRLAGLFLGEVLLLGGLAGVASAALARPLGAAIDVQVSAGRAWLALPVAVGLCLAAASVPALRASRAHPAAALHRGVSPPGRLGGRRRRRVLGLALANLRRAPGRTALGAVALAVGVAGLTLVAAVTWAFHGTVTGTLLGDAVSLRVRGVDLLAVVATVVLGAFAVADVLYLNVRDRAAELAALRATGWSDAALGRLIGYEGLGMGLLGAAAGAGIGLAAAAWFVGELSPSLLRAAVLTAGAGLAIATAAAVVPAVLQRRAPMSILLAEE